MSVLEYDIQNLDCANCASKIEAEIQALPEVHSANLDFINRKLVVQYHSVVDQPLHKLNGIAAAIEPGVAITVSDTEASRRDTALWLILGGSVLLMIASALAPAPFKTWLGIAAWLLAGHRVLVNAGRSLFSKQLFSEQLLMSLATIGAVVLGEYVEAAAVMVLYEFGQWLEARAVDHSRRSIRGMLSLKPDQAHLLTSAGVVDTRLGDVSVGATIIVNPGERVPLDGVIQKGESTVDTSTLTGEAEPLYVNPGAEIFAGFLNHSGLLEIKVTSGEAESTVTRILNLIDNAGARKSQQEKFITRFARVYTPAVVAIAFLVFLIPTLLGHPAAVWFRRSLVFLIVSCPCALVISIPLSYYIGIGVAAKKGIIFKGSEFVDVLRRVKNVVFDKTGTLTHGKPNLLKVVGMGISETEALQLALSLESASAHPLAKAIVSAAGEKGLRPLPVNDFKDLSGRGVEGQVGERKLCLGSSSLLRERAVAGLESLPEEPALTPASKVYLADQERVLGVFYLADTLHPEALAVVNTLKDMGIVPIMLSGDNEETAAAIAAQCGISKVRARALPQDKANIIKELQAEYGPVAMVGDGINDAPALKIADIGIAMGQGTDIAIEAADITILRNNLELIPQAVRLSLETFRKIRQNLFWAFFYNLVAIPLAVFGALHPVIAEIAMASSSVTVVSNANLLRRKFLAQKR